VFNIAAFHLMSQRTSCHVKAWSSIAYFDIVYNEIVSNIRNQGELMCAT